MTQKTNHGDRKFINGRRVITEEEKNKIVRRYTDPIEPWSISSIINIYGFSHPIIKRVLEEAGIELRTGRN